MPLWIRVDANFDSHPKAIAAGKWGRRAVKALWCAAKIHGRRGVLSPAHASGSWLAEFTRDGPDDADGYQSGIEAAVSAKLLHRLADGSIEIHDWGEYQWDETAAERMRRYRERKTVDESRDTRHGDGGYANVTDVTVVTAVTATPPHPDPTPTPHDKEGKEGNTTPPASPPACPAEPDAGEQVAKKRTKEKKAKEDYISGLLPVMEKCYADAHGMVLSAKNGVRRQVIGHLVAVAKADGYRTTAANTAEVERLLAAYFADQDPFVADGKHPITMLLTSRVDRYRRPLSTPAAAQVKANA